jgi:hypothetical protein
MRIVFSTATFVAALSVASSAQQFSLVGGGIPGVAVWSNGVELADVDGDGDIDVLFANGNGYGAGGALQQHLFLNDGSGGLTAAHANLNVGNFNAQMVIAEDFDGDGDKDLMYAPEGPFPATNQVPRILINNGAGVFSNQSAARLPAITMAAFCVAAGDVDNDGDLDVVFTDGATFGGVPTQARLYLNDGNGFFSDATAARMPADTYNAQDVTLLDWDGDYDIDIALSGKGQTNKRSRLYLNDGTGHFVVSNALDQVGTGSTYEVDFGDLDGDRDADAMVQSISGMNEGWARNEGPTTAATKFTFPNPNGQDDNEMAGMDYDNDGDLDVFVGSLGFTEKVYRNTGASFVSTSSSVIQSQSDPTLDLGFADLNGDKRYDMVTAQGEFGNHTNRWYMNSGPVDSRAPRYLRIEQPSLVAPETVFRAQIRDAISDDGHVNATVSYSYSTIDGASGSGQAMHQGSGMFRGTVPTTAATTQATVTWTATDAAGNVSVSPLIVVPSSCATRNGSGINPVDYACVTLPVTGASWQTTITAKGDTVSTIVAIAPAPDIAGSPNPFGTGEVLIGLAPFPTLFAGLGAHSVPVPANPALIGKSASTQGFRVNSAFQIEALNALDIVVTN